MGQGSRKRSVGKAKGKGRHIRDVVLQFTRAINFLIRFRQGGETDKILMGINLRSANGKRQGNSMRTAAILRRVTLAAGYAVMPFLLTDALHPPQCLSSGVVLYGYAALALFLAVEKKPWLNALHASLFFLFVFLLSFLSAENFSMSPGDFCRFVLSPSEEHNRTTDIQEFLASLALMFPVVFGIFSCLYVAAVPCAQWMRRRIHADVQRQADA